MGQEAAQAFKEMLRLRYRALEKKLEEGQDLVLEYHTPSGDRIRVNQVFHVLGTDMLILQGYGYDRIWCEILVQAPNLHTMFRIVSLPEQPAERRPIGFVSFNPQGEQSEEE